MIEYNEMLEVINEDCLEFIFIFDESGNIISCSDKAAHSIGHRAGEVQCKFEEIFSGLALEELRDGDVVCSNIYRKNKTCFPADIKLKKLKNGNFMIFAMDRTESQNLSRELAASKEELKEEIKYKTEFVSNITHELRTPVNGIQGMAKNLMSTELSPYQLETVRIIENCCINMSRIINDLLDFSKMESDRLVLESREFSFREFLNKTMAFNVKQVNDKGLKLLVNVGDDIPNFLIGDELRLTQILNNLISNAVKFTTIGHVAVEVSLTHEEDDFAELFFMIIDTGIGIAKGNMNRLFKKFSQVDASTTRKFGGTGLGLSICKKLVEMMGGDIKVESELGKGSTFSFNVILKKAENAEKPIDTKLPSGNFIYEGSGKFLETEMKSSYASGYSSGWKGKAEKDNIYKFGTVENIREIHSALDKLLICIELGNWEKAENFSSVVKNLISNEESEQTLKKEAFRLELIIRRGNHDKAIEQFNSFKAKLSELGF